MRAVPARDVYDGPWTGPRAEERIVSRRGFLRLRRSRLGTRDIDLGAAARWCRAGWDREWHEPLLRQLASAAEVLVELLEPGDWAPAPRLLDVGAGDGNLALTAAARGAQVEACDIAPRMVERGPARTAGAGLDVAWRVADAQALPYADGAFDVVVSSFGAILAPDHGATAHELELRTRTLPLRFPSADEAFTALSRPFRLDGAELAALRPHFDRLLSSCNNRPPAVEIDARYICIVGRTATSRLT